MDVVSGMKRFPLWVVMAIAVVVMTVGVEQVLGGRLEGDGTEVYGDYVPPTTGLDLRPAFHFMPEKNWMNDPNGPMYWNGLYHLFYQYNPTAAVWGDMHWGHAVSEDLVYWKHLPIALAPSMPYDQGGIWSGSATVVPTLNGNGSCFPILMYTGIGKDGNASQCGALALDLEDKFLLNWTKVENNPLIPAPPLELGNVTGWRDPTSAWLGKTGLYHILVGTGLESTNNGSTILYSSKDMMNWKFERLVGDGLFPGNMYECPDFYELVDELGATTSVLKASASGQEWWATGDIGDDHRFEPKMSALYDYGKLYASKSFWDSIGGRRILYGWVMEDDSSASQVARGWAGVQCLPRVLTLNLDGTLSMNPMPELEQLRMDNYTYPAVNARNGSTPLPINGTQLEIEVTFDPAQTDAEQFGLQVLTSLEEWTEIYINKTSNTINVKRENSSLASDANNSTVSAPVSPDLYSFHVFVDHSVIEVFSDFNKHNIIARVYPTLSTSVGVGIFARDGNALASQINVWTLSSIWDQGYGQL